jgi:DNA-binding MarR family transcriptional regulator
VTSARQTSIKQTSTYIDEITAQWRRERPDLDLDKLLLAIYLQRLGMLIHDDFERYCQSQFKMRASDVRLLLALRRSGPPYSKRPTDLFRALLVTSGAVTKQVDRLEKRRLVKRLPDRSYGGGFQVQLTDAGRKFVDKVVAALADGMAVAQPVYDLPAADLQAAMRFCFKAISVLEQAREANGRVVKTARRSRTPRAAAAAHRQA